MRGDLNDSLKQGLDKGSISVSAPGWFGRGLGNGMSSPGIVHNSYTSTCVQKVGALVHLESRLSARQKSTVIWAMQRLIPRGTRAFMEV